jgi:hypothetical protein
VLDALEVDCNPHPSETGPFKAQGQRAHPGCGFDPRLPSGGPGCVSLSGAALNSRDESERGRLPGAARLFDLFGHGENQFFFVRAADDLDADG